MRSTAFFATALAASVGVSNAFFRMECHSRTGIARIDPLVEPGGPSTHAHVIHGGNNFGFNTKHEDLRASKCSSCRVTEDKSAYWTPSLHFVHPNGTIELVQQVGGMLAYYNFFKAADKQLTAFPDGFRMFAGDSRRRNFSAGALIDPDRSHWGDELRTQPNLAQRALGFNCLNYKKAAEATAYRHVMPSKEYMDENCADGIRAELWFPSCWNGKDLDSSNHKDHMAYPSTVNDGVCPEGFDTRVPTMLFETIWATAAFKNSPGEFVWSNGDPTGYGYHGDFISGWDAKFLQSALDKCTNPSGRIEDCPVFNQFLQTEQEAAKCLFNIPKELKDENCASPREALPGNVQIQPGPEYAKAPAKSPPASAPVYTPPPTPSNPAPVVSYQTPKSMVTDQYGGGVSVAKVNGNEGAPAEPTEGVIGTKKAGTTSSAAPAAPSTTVAAAPASPSAPSTAVTAAPSSPSAVVLSTTTYTSAGTVYEVAIAKVEVTVTVSDEAEASATGQAYGKRHLHHRHHRRDREHGLLRL